MSSNRLASLLLWFGFAWFYYGSIFPDTYFAKESTGVPVTDTVNLAFMHQLRLLDLDPTGSYAMIIAQFSTIVLAIRLSYKKILGLKVNEENAQLTSIGLGIVLYQLYFYYAGGDYMAGRLMSISILMSIFILLVGLEHKFNFLKFTFVILVLLLSLCLKLSGTNLFVPRMNPTSMDDIDRAFTLDMRRFKQNWYYITQAHAAKDWREIGLKRAVCAETQTYPVLTEDGSAGVTSRAKFFT